MTDWKDRKILIVGAARQGTALASYLARHGAKVTITDLRSADELGVEFISMKSVVGANHPIRWALGGHPLSLLYGIDLLCLSGGVPPTIPLVQAAKEQGISLSNDSQIFLERAPCLVIGITGSSGKSTTTALVGQITQFAPQMRNSTNGSRNPKVWVGGNIGSPLITVLDEMNEFDIAVMELSSFQLELMTSSPQIATVLNVTPNHLDRHGSMEVYTNIKARIHRFQSPSDAVVLNRDDPISWNMAQNVHSNVWSFGLLEPEPEQPGTYLTAQSVTLRTPTSKRDTPVVERGEIKLRGVHNLLNVMAACTIAAAAGIPVDSMRSGIRMFKGIPHRLEFVRTWGGANWFNDSIATSPERSMAAIRSFDEPIILLAGGQDKDLPWEEFAELVRDRVKHVIVFGEASEVIIRAIETAQRVHARETGTSGAATADQNIIVQDGLDEAVAAASELVEPGDVVLLSPGGTSFDQFKDFEERGECFARLVNDLT